MDRRRSFSACLIMACALFSCALFCWCGLAQENPDPSLHRRSDASAAARPPAIARLSGVSSLPADASGEYMIDEEGSVVQITIENNRLTGYITKLVERESTLTFFFAQATLGGRQIRFTTRQIHGMWYSFDGEIVRGQAASETENGFYLLRGTLILHTGNSQQPMTVSYASTPRS